MSSRATIELAREVARLEVYIEKLLDHCRRAGAYGYPLLDPVGTTTTLAGRKGAS